MERIDTRMLAAAVRNMSAAEGYDRQTARGLERWAVRHFWLACIGVADGSVQTPARPHAYLRDREGMQFYKDLRDLRLAEGAQGSDRDRKLVGG